MNKGFCDAPLASDPLSAYSQLGLQRIQVLVQGNEGFESPTGVDGCGSDHGGQNLHVHYGTVKQWTKEWHLQSQKQAVKQTLKQKKEITIFYVVLNK